MIQIDHAPYDRYTRLKFDCPHERVLRITLSNGKVNAVDMQMHTELSEIWRDVASDQNVGAIIITGEGATFSAGGDFGLVEKIVADPYTRAAQWKEVRQLVHGMIECPKPIISAMRGVAVGAGLACGLLADISIATRDCRLIDGHTRLGVAAGDHAAIIWPLLCGLAKAKYYLLTCKPVLGEEAERIGLISLTTDEASLDSTALETAVALAEGAPTAIGWTKHALNNWLRQAGPIFDASLALELLGFAGAEVGEGLKSHLEKRPPQFPRQSPI